MSRFDLPEEMWLAFRAGWTQAQVHRWMDRAREHKQHKRSPEAITICTRSARAYHREYCKFLSQAMDAHGERG